MTDGTRGGSVRVGVWAAPDPASPTLGGAAVRALVLPQLFVATPDGRWASALAEPGSDRTADDQRSASFRMRPAARWTDDTPITVDDLRRSADERFVAGVDDPAADGTITVRFHDRLPGWRRLWSAQDSVAPPRPDVWGGPFVVASVTPDLETVLARNDRWWGNTASFLDEVRLVLVPDATTARLLLDRNELDVLMPPAATARIDQFERLPGVTLDRAEGGGWSVAVETNLKRLDIEQRRAVLQSLDRVAFVRTLLDGEAALLDGFAGPKGTTWAAAPSGDVGALKGLTLDLVGFSEEPMTALVHRSMQKRARAAGGTIELRQAESDRVETWVRDGDFEAAVVVALDPPGQCWTCRWTDVAGGQAADTGDPGAVAAFEQALEDQARVRPLWRPVTVVAWRDGWSGVQANGYAASAAWNAWEWSRRGG